MKRLLTALACAAALGAGGAAQAALITFNDPTVIVIDPDTTVATYTEAGYNISGPATNFLLIGDASTASVLVGGFDGTYFSLKAADSGRFALGSFDFGAYDLGIDAGELSVSGLLDGTEVVSQAFGLGAGTSASFGVAWADLTEVRFSATSGFFLDNISAVPEPGTLLLSSGALVLMGAGMGATQRRRRAGGSA